MKLLMTCLCLTILSEISIAQEHSNDVLQSQIRVDTLPLKTDTLLQKQDTVLRISNLTPYFTQPIDSPNVYQFQINKKASNYYWYLVNSPVGLTINKDNGKLHFNAAKNYFFLGKLKYDYPYKVILGVQSLQNSSERIDTFFTISFYNTEIIPSRVKLSVAGPLTIDEAETVKFRVECENGTIPFENILFTSSIPIQDYKPVQLCNDEFSWTPDFDFVKDNDPDKEKSLTLFFIGTTRSQVKDTASIRIIVKNTLNYPQAKEVYELLNKNIHSYILQLKFTFLQLDKELKKTKSFRTGFDLTSATTALTGTVLAASGNTSEQKTGQILPSVGVALVPIKEAASPTKTVEQNQASQIRSTIIRLEYMLNDNALIGEKDNDIVEKTNKLKEELKQAQVQLIDIPLAVTGNMTEEELNNYFNSPKVNKKYRLKSGK